MQNAKLLAQHPAGDQQRLGDRSQVGMVHDKIADPCLELGHPDHADLEAEVAQRTPQIILDVEGFCLQQLPAGQQHPSFLAGQRLDMHRTVQTDPHHMGDAARIIAVTFVELRRQRRLHVPRLDADHW